MREAGTSLYPHHPSPPVSHVWSPTPPPLSITDHNAILHDYSNNENTFTSNCLYCIYRLSIRRGIIYNLPKVPSKAQNCCSLYLQQYEMQSPNQNQTAIVKLIVWCIPSNIQVVLQHTPRLWSRMSLHHRNTIYRARLIWSFANNSRLICGNCTHKSKGTRGRLAGGQTCEQGLGVRLHYKQAWSRLRAPDLAPILRLVVCFCARAGTRDQWRGTRWLVTAGAKTRDN